MLSEVNSSLFLESFSSQGRQRLQKNWAIFVFGKIYISLNISIEGLAEALIFLFRAYTCWTYQNTWWTWIINTHFYYLAKFTKRFRQVQQVQALNKKKYEDLCSPLIDAYKLAVTRQYLFLVKYKLSRRKK